MPEVKTKFLPKDDLAKKIQEAKSKSHPDPGSATTNKGYWIQGIVRNCTQFDLKVRPPPYFNSGRYEVHPDGISAFSISHFTAVNGDNDPGGATGGNAWDLPLDSNVQFNVAFGFTWPVWGAGKSAVVESTNAKDGYDNATKGGNKITSKNQYQGEDTDGKEMTIVLEVDCSGGQRPVYTITQVIV